jgi:hypothetical protein
MLTRIITETRPTTNTLFIDDFYVQVLGKKILFNEQEFIDSGEIKIEISTSPDNLTRNFAATVLTEKALKAYFTRCTKGSTEEFDSLDYIATNKHEVVVSFLSKEEEDTWNNTRINPQ